MAKQQQYLGVFEGMDFGTYEYQHYPLAMYKKGDDRDFIAVNNEDEQKAAEAEGYVAPKVGPPANITVKDVEELNSKLEDKDAEILKLRAMLAAKAAPGGGKGEYVPPPTAYNPDNPNPSLNPETPKDPPVLAGATTPPQTAAQAKGVPVPPKPVPPKPVPPAAPVKPPTPAAKA